MIIYHYIRIKITAMKVKLLILSVVLLLAFSCGNKDNTSAKVKPATKEEPITGSDAELLEALKNDQDVVRLTNFREQSTELFTVLVYQYGNHDFLERVAPCDELSTTKLDKKSPEYELSVSTCKEKELTEKLNSRYKKLVQSENLAVRKKAAFYMSGKKD